MTGRGVADTLSNERVRPEGRTEVCNSTAAPAEKDSRTDINSQTSDSAGSYGWTSAKQCPEIGLLFGTQGTALFR
uniref:Uncharacterized protein n=1 Tax=Anguilla anguilla TaxID=7936 RepID=A0A0E9VVZ9_ANGAN